MAQYERDFTTEFRNYFAAQVRCSKVQGYSGRVYCARRLGRYYRPLVIFK